ncbi:hypothetical protein D3C71_1594570 [compost metagenome]
MAVRQQHEARRAGDDGRVDTPDALASLLVPLRADKLLQLGRPTDDGAEVSCSKQVVAYTVAAGNGTGSGEVPLRIQDIDIDLRGRILEVNPLVKEHLV